MKKNAGGPPAYEKAAPLGRLTKIATLMTDAPDRHGTIRPRKKRSENRPRKAS